MDWLQALILGLIQGLTEFLPVSSSGHLELGKVILGLEATESLSFTVVVHGATVLSTIVVFRKDIGQLLKGLLAFRWNWQTRYVALLLFSMIPVLMVGLFLKEPLEALFTGNLLLVGSMLLITASLLTFSYYFKPRQRPITFADAFIIGVAQALAVLPGISRSGSTIATSLLLGKKREEAARFSFLMVLIPILGANLLDLLDYEASQSAAIGAVPLIVGFFAAFMAGLLACQWMIRIVNRGKLIYFAIYCLIIGTTAIAYSLLAG